MGYVVVLLLVLGALVQMTRAAGRRLEREEREAPRRLSQALEHLKAGNRERVPALLAAAFYTPTDGHYSATLLELHRMVLLVARDELGDRFTPTERQAVEAWLARLAEVAQAPTPPPFDVAMFRPVRRALRRIGGPLAPDPSQKAAVLFARRVLAKVHAAGHRAATFDEDAFCIKVPGLGTLNLGRGFGVWQAASTEEERRSVEAEAADSLLHPEEVPGTYAEARARLLPRLRSLSGREANRLFLELKDVGMEPPPCVPVAGDLVAELMWDGERSVSPVDETQLQEWGVTFEDAMAEALRNLAEKKGMMIASPGGFSDQGPKVFMSTTGDFHNCARLMVPQVLRGMKLPADLVAMAPVEGHLVLADPGDPAAMLFMATSATTWLEENGRCLSTDLLRLEGDRWVPWELPADHPVSELFRKVRVVGQKLTCDRQQQLLKALLEKRGEDIFVASLMAYAMEDGTGATTVCSWADEVHSLLPKADKVAFRRLHPDGQCESRAEVPWDRMMQVVGHLVTPKGMTPERYEVTAFPTEEELLAMAQPVGV